MATKRKLAVFVLMVALLAKGAEPPTADIYHLAGDVSADAVIDMSKGPPCVSDELIIARGVTLTIAAGTTLQVNHQIKSKYGSRLILMPGVTVKFGEPKGSLVPGMRLGGTLEIRGTKERPVNIYDAPGVGINDARHCTIQITGDDNNRSAGVDFAHAHFHNSTYVRIMSADKVKMANCSFNDICQLYILVFFSWDANVHYNTVLIDKCTFASNLTFQNCDVIATDCRMIDFSVHLDLNSRVYEPDNVPKGVLGITWPQRMDQPSMIFRRCQFSGFSADASFYHTKPLVMFEDCNLSGSNLTWVYRDVNPERYMKYHDIPKELVAELDPQTHKNILFRNCRWDPEKMPRMANVYPVYEGTSPESSPGKDLPTTPPVPDPQPPSPPPSAPPEANQPWTVPVSVASDTSGQGGGGGLC